MKNRKELKIADRRNVYENNNLKRQPQKKLEYCHDAERSKERRGIGRSGNRVY